MGHSICKLLVTLKLYTWHKWRWAQVITSSCSLLKSGFSLDCTWFLYCCLLLTDIPPSLRLMRNRIRLFCLMGRALPAFKVLIKRDWHNWRSGLERKSLSVASMTTAHRPPACKQVTVPSCHGEHVRVQAMYNLEGKPCISAANDLV